NTCLPNGADGPDYCVSVACTGIDAMALTAQLSPLPFEMTEVALVQASQELAFDWSDTSAVTMELSNSWGFESDGAEVSLKLSAAGHNAGGEYDFDAGLDVEGYADAPVTLSFAKALGMVQGQISFRGSVIGAIGVDGLVWTGSCSDP